MSAYKGKAVVTGGAGFIGSHIVRTLLDRGFETHVIDNFVGGKRADRFHADAAYHEVDIRDSSAVTPLLKGARFVFHEAALPRVPYSIEHPEETFSVNALGTISVLTAAHEAGVERLVYAASSSAYGDQETLLLSENLPARPASPYGLQKYVGELACRLWSELYGLSTVSLRYFNVYGPGFDPEGPYALVIGKFLAQRAAGKPLTITGDGTQTRDFTHVHDIVAANILAAESLSIGHGEVINIGGGNSISINRLAELIGGPVEHIAPRIEPHDNLADIRRAKELLGWEPRVPFVEGVAELKRAYRLS